jgi:hypothetical protein
VLDQFLLASGFSKRRIGSSSLRSRGSPAFSTLLGRASTMVLGSPRIPTVDHHGTVEASAR